MKKFIVEIQCDSAAFQGNVGPSLEVARILKTLAGKLERNPKVTEVSLYDLNGNKAGYAVFAENSPSVFEKKQYEVSDQPMPNDKSPNGPTTGPQAPFKERALKIGQELVNNLNFNVLAEHEGRGAAQAFLRKTYPQLTEEEIKKATAHIPKNPSNVVPFPQDEARQIREKLLTELRKQYPHLTDDDLTLITGGLV